MKKPKKQPVMGAKDPAIARNKQAVSPGASLHALDKQLVPRVEAYSQNNSLSDPQAVASALQSKHPEYKRKTAAAFQTMVLRAIAIVQARQQQQDQEQHGLAAVTTANSTPNSSDGVAEPSKAALGHTPGQPALDKAASQSPIQSDASVATSSASSEGDDTSSSSSSSGSDSDEGSKPVKDRGGMNNMLMSMYARTPRAQATRDGDVDGKTSEASPAPFAPLEQVAAAAKRALIAEKAGKQGKGSTQQPTAAADAQQPSKAVVTDQQQVGLVVNSVATVTPAAGQADATPAPAVQTTSKANARTASEAGLQGVSTVKRSRQGGRTGGAAAGPGAGAGPKPRSSSAVVAARAVTYADLGGIEDVLDDIRELIEFPLKHPEVYSWLGVEPPRGVLLHGPPGCGKTALANAIANECGVPFLRVSAPEIVSGMSGESEAKLRGLFQEAIDLAPCIVFIDEIDAIAPKRETAQREMERRIVAQMLTCMDDLSAPANPSQPTGQPHDRQADPAQGSADRPSNPDAVPAKVARPHVVVIGATNRPDALDPALRRAGRFDREISLGIPSEAARAKILAVITRGLRLEGNFDFKHIAKRTPGYVGADLMALVKEAAALAVRRIFATIDQQAQQTQVASTAGQTADNIISTAPLIPTSIAAATIPTHIQPQQQDVDMTVNGTGSDTHVQPAPDQATEPGAVAVLAAVVGRFGQGPLGPAELAGLAISMADFGEAIKKVQPSVRREGFTTTPDVTWDDVGSLTEVREELSFSITAPIMHPERFEAMGMSTATGVLLYGPPGCGKTLVAKAVANESGANFISIKGPELLNKYVGESERAVRQLFARARAAHPCVLFFDELDALAPRRGTDTNQAAERVVNQLLTEMDGVDGRTGVYVVAATNRPDMIDPALLRPGRLDKVLYVPLPPPDGRAAILHAVARKTPLAADVDLTALGHSEQCNGFSGADMAALVREASKIALKEAMQRDLSLIATAVGASSSTKPESGAANKQHEQGSWTGVAVEMRHFKAAMGDMAPSVSKRDARMYDALRKSLRGNLRSSRLEGNEELLPKSAAAGQDVRLLGDAPLHDGMEGMQKDVHPHAAGMQPSLPGAGQPEAPRDGDVMLA